MPQRIDEALLRKRAEHNDGELSTLKEVTLHQYGIEKIENLDVHCRHLELLFLQNNLIAKIENLNKLKELQYLNLAINNITKLENLQGCESLTKLDLTLNFIQDPLDVESLAKNEFLRELYLVGNPCCEREGYWEYVITALPQLTYLDGREIEKSQRIAARQVYDSIRARLIKERDEGRNCCTSSNSQSSSYIKGAAPSAESSAAPILPSDVPSELSKEEFLEQKRQEFQKKPVPFTPEARIEAARDIAMFNEKEPSKPDPLKPVKGPTRLFTDDGRPLQTNQGKWNFHVKSTDETVELHLKLPKLLDTSLIDVDVHPTYVTVTVKGKYFQLALDEQVDSDGVLCERSKMTGELVVTMLKAGLKDLDVSFVRRQTLSSNAKNRCSRSESKKKMSRYEEMMLAGPVDYRNIVIDNSSQRNGVVPQPKIIDRKGLLQTAEGQDPEDNPEVPPLY
ncbi:hypothetical protein SeMB42_g03608 [Synchytrium endobioticum]|uniref:Dynein axonemal assembly factor 11-like CS domain-containing protein n=1 Tax=Synchytrium endobioticum TaxID=286115 RepID=A0A507D623_9FUNG|nr:hypothetical protein SeMB42_g03608 [Synchytrium endobioticum]TPX49566.1 hypothetical protein SeLEV6574_g01390 [Synchytrium endobioticum]